MRGRAGRPRQWRWAGAVRSGTGQGQLHGTGAPPLGRGAAVAGPRPRAGGLALWTGRVAPGTLPFSRNRLHPRSVPPGGAARAAAVGPEVPGLSRASLLPGTGSVQAPHR